MKMNQRCGECGATIPNRGKFHRCACGSEFHRAKLADRWFVAKLAARPEVMLDINPVTPSGVVTASGTWYACETDAIRAEAVDAKPIREATPAERFAAEYDQ